MRIIDTHCHYNMSPLHENWQEHWQKAQEHDVVKSIVVGADVLSSKNAVELCQTEEHLFPTIGVHPGKYQEDFEAGNNNLFSQLEHDLAELEKLSTHPKVTAVGEVGLDYFRLPEKGADEVQAVQRLAFEKQLLLAKSHHLPVTLHVRDKAEQAYWEVLDILQKVAFDQKFILHCVSGPLKYVMQAVEMGAYIGVAGNVTYKSADHIRQLVTSVPQTQILLETDAPFLPPKEFRGRQCEPWMIHKTAEFLEQELHISTERIWQNTRDFFGSKMNISE